MTFAVKIKPYIPYIMMGIGNVMIFYLYVIVGDDQALSGMVWVIILDFGALVLTVADWIKKRGIKNDTHVQNLQP